MPASPDIYGHKRQIWQFCATDAYNSARGHASCVFARRSLVRVGCTHLFQVSHAGRPLPAWSPRGVIHLPSSSAWICIRRGWYNTVEWLCDSPRGAGLDSVHHWNIQHHSRRRCWVDIQWLSRTWGNRQDIIHPHRRMENRNDHRADLLFLFYNWNGFCRRRNIHDKIFEQWGAI